MVVYVIELVLNIFIDPYIFDFNNRLDTTFYCLNTIYSIIPVLALWKVYIPDFLSVPISVAVCVLPFISIIYSVCCVKKKIGADDDVVPWAYIDDEGEIKEDVQPDEVADEEIEIDPGDFNAIWQLQEMEGEDLCVDQLDPSGKVVVSKHKLYETLSDMYKDIDKVCDASTIEELTDILNIVLWVGMFSFGWFVGASRGRISSTFVDPCN